MPDAGYVYVLINPSMEGLVKIGKTTQDPKERAKELSATTGVPTPFILVFDAYFEDCSKAEEYVQTRLEQKNYRVSSNREFFVAPVNEAVTAVLEAQSVFGTAQDAPVDDRTREKEETTIAIDPSVVADMPPWYVVFELAEAADCGYDDTLEDPQEALRLYKQAAKLGSPDACLRIGRIYRDKEELRDDQQALAYFKEGASRGLAECYAEMSELFAKSKQFDNAHKCWSKYFKSENFLSNALDRGRYGCNYLKQAKYNGLPIKHKDTLLQIRDEILRNVEKMVCFSKKEGDRDGVLVLESEIPFIRLVLYSEDTLRAPLAPRNLVRGKIKWFDHEKGFGFIQQDSGDDVYLHECDIIGGPCALQEGQQVEFEMVRGPKAPMAWNVRLL